MFNLLWVVRESVLEHMAVKLPFEVPVGINRIKV